MAKYDVTFSCGHTEKVDLLGKKELREWRIAQMQEKEICFACKEKEKEKAREKQLQKIESVEKEHELQPIKGSPKQIDWARQIRVMMISSIELFQEDAQRIQKTHPDFQRFSIPQMQEFIAATFEEIIQKENKASFYIDNRDLLFFSTVSKESDLRSQFTQLYEKIKREKMQKEEQKKEEEVLSEITVYPKKYNKKPVIQIFLKQGKVEIETPPDPKAQEVLRNLRFYWDGQYWTKEITFRNGTGVERAAEAANRLLLKGYAVACEREAVRKKAVSGKIKPEHERWIDYNKERNVFLFYWEKNKDLYEYLRAKPDAKYIDYHMEFPETAVDVIKEASSKLDFQLSKRAIEFFHAKREDRKKKKNGKAGKIIKEAKKKEYKQLISLK